VRVTWLEALRTRSFAHLYMATPTTQALPRHRVWQSPFVLAPSDEPWEAIASRVRRAGELWLVNYDLRPTNELIIAHVSEPWFMAFQRAERPDEGHISIGPIDRRVLAAGEPLFALPLIYRESERSTGRELWRQLAHA
jgi:hypothetical protein